MPEIAAAFISIAPSFKNFNRDVTRTVGASGDQASNAFGKRFGSKMGGQGKSIGRSFGKALTIGATGAAAGAAIGAVFLKGAVSEAGNLEQSVGAINAIFGRSSKQMNRWSKGAAQAVGLSRNEFNELGALIGAQLKNGGTAMDDLAPKTNKLIGLGADLAAMFGGTTKDSVAALSSALKGERDPIERYGVSLSQVKIDAKAAALGFEKVGNALSAEANQAATLALIMEQTKDAHGAAARESNTLASQQQKLGAQWTNMKATLGTALLPVVTRFVTYLNQSVLPAFNRLRPTLMQIGTYIKASIVPAIQSFGASIAPLVTKVAGLFTGMRNGSGALTEVQSTFTSVFASVKSTVTSAVTIVQRLWSLFGNNIVRSLRESFGNILRIVKGTFNVISGVFKVVASVLKGDWSGAWNGIKQVTKGAGQIVVGLVRQVGNMIRTAFSTMATAVKATFKGMWNAVKQAGSNVLGWFKGLPGKIAGYVAGFSTLLYNAGRELIGGLISGITEKAKDLAGAMGKIASIAKDRFPGSPVKKGPLTAWNQGKAGKRLMQMLIDGINSSTGAVSKAVERVADGINKALKRKDITKGVAKQMRGLVAIATKEAGRLRELIVGRKSMAADIASSFRGEFDLSAITAPNEFGFSASPASAVKAAQGIVARMKAFAGRLAALIKKGMPASLVQEIAGMGSVEGMRVADVFAKSTTAQIGQLRAAETDFQTYAKTAGFAVANATYGHQIKMQREDLRDMEKAVERGLRNARIDVRLDVGRGSAVRIYQLGKSEAERRK